MNLQIESKKVEWKAESRIGSLDNAKHNPGGGDKKVCSFSIWLELYYMVYPVPLLSFLNTVMIYQHNVWCQKYDFSSVVLNAALLVMFSTP